jgi:hypothetical protein
MRACVLWKSGLEMLKLGPQALTLARCLLIFLKKVYTHRFPGAGRCALDAGRWTLERQLTKPAYHRRTQVMRFVHVAVAAFCCAK